MGADIREVIGNAAADLVTQRQEALATATPALKWRHIGQTIARAPVFVPVRALTPAERRAVKHVGYEFATWKMQEGRTITGWS